MNTREGVRRWREEGPVLFDELLGAGNWILDESDFGLTIGVGFTKPDGKLHAIYLARIDRREAEDRNGPDDDRSFVLSEAEARAAIERAITPPAQA